MGEQPPNTRAVAGAIAVGCLPFGLWFVLNYLRPDLVAPMLEHAFGYVITLVETILTLAGLAAYLTAVTAKREPSGLRTMLVIGAVVLCTLPALLLVLFGPIVFAFMYGNLGA